MGTILFDSRDPQNEMVKLFGAFEVTTRLIKSAYLIDGESQKVYRGKNLDNITQTYQQVSGTYEVGIEMIFCFYKEILINMQWVKS